MYGYIFLILLISFFFNHTKQPFDTPTSINLGNNISSKKERQQYRKELKKLTNKPVRFMTEDELEKAKSLNIKLQEFDEALIHLKQLIKVTQSITTAKKSRLEIADIYFQIGNLKEAAKSYEEYISLYPGDKEKVAYASYKGILSNFYSILPPDRDQTATLKTISLAHNFLNNKSSLFSLYQKDVEDIKKQCLTRLWEKDTVVVQFHMTQKSFESAHICIADAREKLLPQIPHVEPSLLQLEYKLALAEKNTQTADELAKKLQPFSDIIKADELKKRPNFAHRF